MATGGNEVIRRLRTTSIISAIALLLMAMIDMFLVMNWAGKLMSPLAVLPVFLIAYIAVPLVAKHVDDK